MIEIPRSLPLLPIRELIVFPNSVIPLLVGRERSLTAIEYAKRNHHLLLIATQKNAEKEEIRAADIFRVGTVSRILQIMELPNGHSKIVVEGITRARIKRYLQSRKFFHTEINVFADETGFTEPVEPHVDQMFHYFQEYVSHSPDLPDEMADHLNQQGDLERMIDFVALNVQADTKQKQDILEERNLDKRLIKIVDLLKNTIGLSRARQEIDRKVQDNLLKNQRNYYLQEKMRVINKELGEEEDPSPEILKLEEDIHAANLPAHALEKAQEEVNKLKKIPPFSPEYTVTRNYLDWMLRVPWNKHTKDRLDIQEAQRILDEDHFGLEKPKERLIEHLAVIKRVGQIKGPILCFVGPPGVGKTSLGQSVARALGRHFVRVSLGGIRDEAEIRGHRRTYIGSLPGKIIQSMKKAGTRNPVFLLDEVDKMSADFRGDPAAALLEVLDPEQNKYFNDHYLDVDYDLSQVFFITTANVQTNIPLPLQDRMEIIELPGYLEHEKIKIAQLHLIPKQYQAHGIRHEELKIEENAIVRMIREYTREAGVRNLERELANLCRKAVRRLIDNPKYKPLSLTQDNIGEYLGKPTYFNRKAVLGEEIGMATGLAWTTYGGDLLKIEVTIFPGKNQLSLTGKLGEVMQESARAALSYIRSLSSELDIDPEIFEKNDIHVHVPEGAIPKDGPSAGIAIATAMISALTQRPARNNIAMTGELTLRGKILAVGGVNEKLLAAQRNNVSTVIVPSENQKEIVDLPNELRKGITILQVDDYKEVLEHVIV